METTTKKSLLNRLSKNNQDLIFEEAIKYPNTWETVLKELEGCWYTGLTLSACMSIYNAIYPLEPFNAGKFQDLFI